jgi:hypothetical protein
VTRSAMRFRCRHEHEWEWVIAADSMETKHQETVVSQSVTFPEEEQICPRCLGVFMQYSFIGMEGIPDGKWFQGGEKNHV